MDQYLSKRRPKAGDRVGAICGGDKERVEVFGYGIFLGDDEVPPNTGPASMTGMLHDVGMTNAKILLDSGEVVWGCECWWGPEETIRAQVAECKQAVPADLEKFRGNKREHITMGDIRTRIESGEFGPGTYEEHLARISMSMRAMVCNATGFAPERIKKCEFIDIDDAMPGKVAVNIDLDPEVTEAERPAFQRALAEIASMLGSRPPIYPAQA